jgi:hypothetical protein
VSGWRGWRPDPRTFGVLVFLVFAPAFVTTLWELRFYVARLIPPSLNPAELFQTAPPPSTWERVDAGNALVLTAVDLAVVVAGALLVAALTWWGARIAVGALLLDTLGHVLFLIVLVAESPVPTAAKVGAVSSIASRVLLLGVAILLLRGSSPATPEPAT